MQVTFQLMCRHQWIIVLGTNKSGSHVLFTAELYAMLCYWLQWDYIGLKDSDLGTNMVLITPAFGSSGPAAAQKEWFPQASLLHKSLSRCLGLDNPCSNIGWLAFNLSNFSSMTLFPFEIWKNGNYFCKFLSKLKESSIQIFFNMKFNFLLKTWIKSDKYTELMEIIPCWGDIKNHMSHCLLNPGLKSWEPDPQ